MREKVDRGNKKFCYGMKIKKINTLRVWFSKLSVYPNPYNVKQHNNHLLVKRSLRLSGEGLLTLQ